MAEGRGESGTAHLERAYLCQGGRVSPHLLSSDGQTKTLERNPLHMVMGSDTVALGDVRNGPAVSFLLLFAVSFPNLSPF